MDAMFSWRIFYKLEDFFVSMSPPLCRKKSNQNVLTLEKLYYVLNYIVSNIVYLIYGAGPNSNTIYIINNIN